MRISIILATIALGIATADAETSSFTAERGHWWVFSGPKYCRALNRMPADFNFAPYNGLQIVVGRKGYITVEVFFWPDAVMADREYRLRLGFSMSDMVLPARPTMESMLASAPDTALWRALQDARALDVAVEGEPALRLRFHLDDIAWVLDRLTACQRVLPDG